MVKLVVADMDGTLLNSKNELSDQLFEVIRALKEKGIRFAVASGRQYYNLLNIFEEVKDDIYFLAENGNILFYQGERIYINEMNFDSLTTYVKLARNIEGAYPILCGEKTAYFENKEEIFMENAQIYYKRYAVVDDILEAVKQDKICKLAIFDSKDAETNTYPIFNQYQEQNMVSLSGRYWVDIMNLGANKGNGVRFLQNELNIDKTNCMAFGDYLNDYEMMQECYYSYAMANAHDQLKEICNFEAGSNDEDGVVKVLIDKFGLSL